MFLKLCLFANDASLNSTAMVTASLTAARSADVISACQDFFMQCIRNIHMMFNAVNGCSYKGGDFKILRTQLDCSRRLDHHRLDRKVQVGLGIKVVSLVMVMVMVGCEHDHGSGEIILQKRIPLAFELALL